MKRSNRVALLVWTLWSLHAAAASAQQPAPAQSAPMTTTVRAGPQYERAGLWRALFGSTWRDVWAAPITVPVLDLGTFAGGLQPTKQGGNQSKTLRFKGADGHGYIFRSIDKDITKAMPKDMRHSPAGAIVQDQISSLHPSGLLATAVLEDAVGVLHARPQLFMMPDDPRLGKFRDTFKGMLGEVEERADESSVKDSSLAGAKDILATEDVLAKLEHSTKNRIDSREYLKARLMDFIFGDTDRGADQWRWAEFERDGSNVYRAMPRDRDYAFMRANGLFTNLVAHVYPKVTHFGPNFPPLNSLVFMTREFDRSHLIDLPWAAWDSVVTAMQGRLTNDVIDQAVARLPGAQETLSAQPIRDGLRGRRDQLRAIARAFYDMVDRDADVFASDDDEIATIDRQPDGGVRVQIQRAKDNQLVFDRTFMPDVTQSVRVFLERGNDRAVVRGHSDESISVRVMGGEGDDVLIDSSSVGHGDHTRFYDASGHNTFVTGAHTEIIRKPFVTEQPLRSLDEADNQKPEKDPRAIAEERRGRQQDLMNSEMGDVEKKTRAEYARNWGQKTAMLPMATYHDGPGIILGFGPTTTNFGFRRRPYEWQTALHALYGTGSGGFGVQLLSERRFEVAPVSISLFAHATQLESNRFFGYGNNSRFSALDSSLIMRDEVLIEPALNYLVNEHTKLSLGPVARLTRPRHGSSYSQLGAQVEFSALHAVGAVTRQHGLDFSVGASGYPAALDVADAFGEAHALAKAFVPLGTSTLALRVGGKRVWGNAPLHEAAFLGALETLRGYRWNRYVGDASAYGSAELHVPVAYITLFTRGELGLIGFADAGRIWWQGTSPGGWHSGFGGGPSFGTLGHTLSLTYAKGEEGRVYFTFGFPF